MRFTPVILLTALLLITSVIPTANSMPEKKKPLVYFLELNEEIMPGAWRLVQKAVEAAEAKGADYILIRLNTYGGMVDIADSIRTKLLNARATTIVFIDKNAASAGALISIACDSIYMAKGAAIGAATVVDQTGQQMPDKYQSYMRATMRATAEHQGRDPLIAEAMVDDRVHIPGIIDSGQVLTFTTSEAIQHGFCEGQAKNIYEVLEKAGVENYELVEHEVSGLEKIIRFLVNPVVSSLLLMVIFGGIYFELQTPGIGFPLAAAATAAILYFAPHYLEGLAQNWEILLFIGGIILLALEVFVIPGFGVAGIGGIGLIVAGLTLSLVRNDLFDFGFSGFDAVIKALFQVLASFLGVIIIAFVFGKNILKSRFFQELVLQDSQLATEGYTTQSPTYSALIGKEGKALTPLRPSGRVEVENEVYDAYTAGEYIDTGEKIKVERTERYELVVRKIKFEV